MNGKKNILTKLARLANDLDNAGHIREANTIDNIFTKIAFDPPWIDGPEEGPWDDYITNRILKWENELVDKLVPIAIRYRLLQESTPNEEDLASHPELLNMLNTIKAICEDSDLPGHKAHDIAESILSGDYVSESDDYVATEVRNIISAYENDYARDLEDRLNEPPERDLDPY